ncbi:NADH-quinone oxidoreductase, subunit G [Candidatus Nitromaritima sp. SCGC AAA799-A02]|nr:NADH-quinone oxidoreductase, subunit G [Candidatus Nitromaritima sp. SCGC AAA799-A02]
MSDDNQVNITIDGKPVAVPKGTLLVEAAKEIGIDIPVFCYHEKLGPFGCCRMCLVEVEKMPKLTTACTQTVMPDMVVKTDSPKVKKAREGVLEFTLLNHPLDCPVCDKGGECPLQNNTFVYGPGITRMEFDRANNTKATPLSPVITIDRERCIACQRCTRYSDIIEQEQALVMLNRGFNNEVNTFNNEPYATKFSGNVIDICPVGALTNTQFRFQARTWDLSNAETLCAHCGCNCNMVLGSRTNKFMRVETRPNDLVDDGWICDKARFGYGFMESGNRILEATTVSGGERKVAGSLEAAAQVAESLKLIAEEYGPDSVGFIGSPYGTNEELYLYHKMFRLGLGTNNLDHKTYLDTPGLPVDHYDFLDVETASLVLLIGSDPAEELPILDLRIRKAVSRKGVKLAILNDQETALDRFATLSLKYDVGADGTVLDTLASGLAGDAPGGKNFASVTGLSADQMKSMVELVRAGKKVCVIYNPAALTGNSTHRLKHSLAAIGKIPDIECGAIPAAPFTNAVGAMDMGILPDFYPGGTPLSDAEKIRQVWGENAPVGGNGLSAMEMIDKAEAGELKALLIYRANPVVDFPGGKRIEEALKNLRLLVVHDMMETETSRLANIVLPSNGPGYDEGTTTNVGGRVQYRKRGLNTKNPPDWKIVSRMINTLSEEPVEYATSFGVTDELSGKVPGYGDINKKSIKKEGRNREPVAFTNGSVPQIEEPGAGKGLKLRLAAFLFASDKILGASSALAHQFRPSTAHLHEVDAGKLGLAQGDEVVLSANGSEVRAIVDVSNRCNPGAVAVPKVSDEQGALGLAGGGPVSWVEVKKG